MPRAHKPTGSLRRPSKEVESFDEFYDRQLRLLATEDFVPLDEVGRRPKNSRTASRKK